MQYVLTYLLHIQKYICFQTCVDGVWGAGVGCVDCHWEDGGEEDDR